MQFSMTFLFAMIVINCVLAILVGLYSGLRMEHQKQAATAASDDPLVMVHALTLLCYAA